MFRQTANVKVQTNTQKVILVVWIQVQGELLSHFMSVIIFRKADVGNVFSK